MYKKSLDKCADLENHFEAVSRERHSLQQELSQTREQSELSDREKAGREENVMNQLSELQERNYAQEQELDGAFEALAKREQELTMFLSALALLISTLIPTMNACTELSVQKKFLHSEFSRLHKLKQQVCSVELSNYVVCRAILGISFVHSITFFITLFRHQFYNLNPKQ